MMISLILWMLIGVSTGYLASTRGRDPYAWFAIGIILGLFGLMLLYILPPLDAEGNRIARSPPALFSPMIEAIEEQEAAEKRHMPLPTYLNQEWFCIDKSLQQQGPISFLTLQTLWREGKVDASSFVWSEGMTEWKKIADLVELNQALVQPT